jgi:tRNA pseudouridine13 synthase
VPSLSPSTDLPAFRFVPSPQTFVVEEVPAYLPSGAGEHTYLWIEKRGITTLDAVATLARRFGVGAHDVGYAGMKDRHATARQWLSLPGVDPAAAVGTETMAAPPPATGEEEPNRPPSDPRVAILRAERHGNKLRVGHLRGNRFEVVVLAGGTGTDASAEELARRLGALAASGLPNRYGEQRFGAAADNAERGFALLRGELRERDRRRRRLLLSAAQAAVFNEVLARRQATERMRTVLTGDVLQRRESGGVFITEAPDVDQARLDAGELVITGPMPGSWAREPPPETEARALEDEALAKLGITRAAFAAGGRDLPGTRRPLLIPVTLEEPAATEEPAPTPAGANAADAAGELGAAAAKAVRLRFALPAGSYATVVLEQIGVRVEPAAGARGG